MFKNQDSKANGGAVITSQELFSYGRENLTVLDLPELGGKVYIRELSAADVFEYNDMVGKDRTAAERERGQNQMIAKALVNQNGARIIAPGEEDKLSDLPITLFSKILSAVTKEMTHLEEDAGSDVVETYPEDQPLAEQSGVQTSALTGEAREGNADS